MKSLLSINVLLLVFASCTTTVYNQEVISLSLQVPQYNWDISSNATEYYINITNLETEFGENEVKISLVIEELTCVPDINGTFLEIQGANKSMKICSNVNHTETNFQSVLEFFDNEKEMTIFPEGNWNGSTNARLFVTLYVEKESCENCPEKFFCCGAQRTSCIDSSTSKHNDTTMAEQVRCIPIMNGVSPLCDGHPSCGYFCNPDETFSISQNPCTYFKNFPRRDSIVNGDVVWKAILFFSACLLFLSLFVIITSFMNSMMQKGMLPNLLKSKPKCVIANSTKDNYYKRNLTVYESFRYSDEYM